MPGGHVVLVTGGAGFIGSHITDKLLSCNNKVIIADDLSTGKKENINPAAVFYRSDIADENSVRKIFKNHKIDYVIHQAAKINPNLMLEDPAMDVRTSVLGTLNLLKCCVDFKVKKIIYASSVAVYGRPEKLPVSEAGHLVPIYSYGIAKKCAEEYIRYYSEYYGLNYSILRYANVYGPRQPIYGEVGVVAIFTERAINGKSLIIYGDGSHLRDYIYIDDIVDITLRVLSKGDRETFNVGCGMGISVKVVFDHFCSMWKKPLQCEYKPERVAELGFFYCDIGKISNVVQSAPRITLKEGIQRSISYYKNSC